MRIKLLFITGIIGFAVVTGIFKSLTSRRSGEKKEGEETAGNKKACSGLQAINR
jgi:hypothetical protein